VPGKLQPPHRRSVSPSSPTSAARSKRQSEALTSPSRLPPAAPRGVGWTALREGPGGDGRATISPLKRDIRPVRASPTRASPMLPRQPPLHHPHRPRSIPFPPLCASPPPPSASPPPPSAPPPPPPLSASPSPPSAVRLPLATAAVRLAVAAAALRYTERPQIGPEPTRGPVCRTQLRREGRAPFPAARAGHADAAGELPVPCECRQTASNRSQSGVCLKWSLVVSEDALGAALGGTDASKVPLERHPFKRYLRKRRGR